MDSKPVNDPALRNLERTIRLEFERIILSMAIVCVTLEVAIFIYYYLTDNVGQPVNTYVEFRILVPFAINTVLYIITRFSNRSATSTDITKNRVVSFAGLLMCGVISLAHSYFIPLWVFPLFAIVFCSVFHDGFIQIVQSGLSFVFILYAGILHIYDYPDERAYSILCIIIADSWKMTPLAVIFFLAALQAIDKSVYEAARVDGASPFQSFRAITLPALRPTIMVIVVMRTVEKFKAFDIFYLMTRGGPANSTKTLTLNEMRHETEHPKSGPFLTKEENDGHPDVPRPAAGTRGARTRGLDVSNQCHAPCRSDGKTAATDPQDHHV